MKQKSIRIGIIGAGGNTRLRHLPNFQALEAVEVAVICNRNEASSQGVAEAFGVPNIAKTWQEVVANPSLDAICIGTWPYLHAPIAIAALKAGKHVLTEARMAMHLGEAEAMQTAATAHPNQVAQIVPAPRSLDYDATVKRLLGELGPLREVILIDRSGSGAQDSVPQSWRQDQSLSGYNTHTLGIHYETVQRWLGPEVNPAWLVADAQLFIPNRPGSGGEQTQVTIPDAVSVFGRYNTGTRFSFDISTVHSAPPIGAYYLNAEGGSLRFDFITNALFFSETGSGKETVIPPDDGTNLGWQVEADFIESIREEKPVTLTDFASGVRYMRFTERVWQSWTRQSTRQIW